ESGDHDYLRGLFAAAPEIGGGTLLAGLEHSTNNGPWLLEERFHKTNTLLRYSHDTANGRFSVTAQGYDGEWRSRDLIRRAPLAVVALGGYGEAAVSGVVRVAQQRIGLVKSLFQQPRAVVRRVLETNQQRAAADLGRRGEEPAQVVVIAAFERDERRV